MDFNISASDNIKDKISKLTFKDNHKKVIVILGLFGIFLIFISTIFKHDNGKQVAPKGVEVDSESYIDRLEKNLGVIVSSINGAGNAKVLITLESGTQTVYATEEKQNKEISEDKANGEMTRKKESNDCEKKYITIKDSEGTEHALAVTEIQPKIKGVIIVCSGGENPLVQQRIIDAVTTALSISSNKVCVTKSGI